jgi:hypothetical protein
MDLTDSRCGRDRTFPIFTIGTILSDIFAIILHVAIPLIVCQLYRIIHLSRILTCRQGCGSDRRGLGGRSHVHVCHLCEVSSHHGHRLGVEMVCGHHAYEETDDHQLEHHRGLDQSQSAMKQMAEYEPTILRSVEFLRGCNLKIIAYLDLQQIVTANAFVVHFVISIISITTALILNEGESTFSVNDIRVASLGGLSLTHRRLAAVLGAGMSQRTRRP